MKTSANGRSMLEAREGRRLVAYLDSANVCTIGVGHTGRTAPPAVHLGMTITPAECDAFLAADLAPVEKVLNALGVPLTQNQFDALASFIFNVGATAFAKSACRAALLIHDMPRAADDLLHFETPKALANRREAERAQFLRPDSHTVPAAPAAAKPPAAPVAAAPAHPAATKKAPTMAASQNILAEMITGVETKIKDAVSALQSGTATAAGASDKVTAAIGSVPAGVDAAKHLAELALKVRSGDFGGAAKDAEAILADVEAILGKFGVKLALLTEANSLLVKYVG